jgi:diguanylate cyclase (GGDEF)-like protein
VVAPIVESDHDDVLGSIAVCFVGRREPTAHVMAVLAVAVQISAIAIERCRAVKHLTHQALHDQLTGLPNRRLVTERLVEALDARDRTGEVGVMLLDLDRFKVVNDSLGHAVGDRLLVAFAERLGAVVRPGDTVGRFEGDEFVVVLPEIDDANDIRSVTNRLDLALSEPFETEHGALVLSASIGTAISRAGDTPEDLVKHADTACSRAKDLGGDRLEVFDDELRTRAEARLHLERDLRAAIERSDLVLHYQPEIDLTDGQVMGAEALLRWRHLERGLILPGEFIALSEETGLINRIGRWVLAEAVHQARTLADRMPDRDPLLVSVNLSALQLSTPNFVRSVETVLDSFDWRPEHLVFEVTESILIDDTDARLGILRQIHELGILIAIDDFGTGFSSLNYLHRFPVDIIKLDRSFVEPLRADGSGSVVAKAVIHLAHDLGLVVTAEGVETGDQLAGLRALGCDWAQGFHFAEGLPSEELRTLIGTDPVW